MNYDLSSYQYQLPKELIAEYPCSPRDTSRLLIVDRVTGNLSEIVFKELVDFLERGDSLVFNDTKVLPARLYGTKLTGGKVEIFLAEEVGDDIWKVFAKPARKLPQKTVIRFSDSFLCTVIDVLDDGQRLVKFDCVGNFLDLLQAHGEIPLPPYIQRKTDPSLDSLSYQTVYASKAGAVAAPTAGLHFTDDLLCRLTEKEIQQIYVTLHVGAGTFKPVKTEDIRQHRMHSEKYTISQEALQALNHRSKGGKQIVVGTTCCRTLESAASHEGLIVSGGGETDIFIYPGYKFKYVKHLLTNFHLPGSTLLMLVSAFAGRELIMEAYHKAVKEKFRFFSYGDAMLII